MSCGHSSGSACTGSIAVHKSLQTNNFLCILATLGTVSGDTRRAFEGTSGMLVQKTASCSVWPGSIYWPILSLCLALLYTWGGLHYPCLSSTLDIDLCSNYHGCLPSSDFYNSECPNLEIRKHPPAMGQK